MPVRHRLTAPRPHPSAGPPPPRPSGAGAPRDVRRRGRCTGDDGAGVLGMAMGITFFLVFLLFAVQWLSYLYATSSVTAVAYDAARTVARGGQPIPPGTVEQAEQQARRLLGRGGAAASFEWSSDGDQIELTLRVPTPRALPADFDRRVGIDRVERTARVRVETMR